MIAALYAPPDGYFAHIGTTGGVTWGIRLDSAFRIVVCRGSVTPQDWLRDFESEVATVVNNYPSLGYVPYGFGKGLTETYKSVRFLLQAQWLSPIIICGHSLGAAHAAELAGMFVADNINVARIVLCGCPKPGMIALSALLSKTGIANYCNARDPVPDVPVTIPPILAWCAVSDKIMLNEQATDSSWHGLTPEVPLADHNIALYQKGVRSL